ncbi:hypothetical protein RJ639_018603, partial [Escallonia herrerae]
WSMGKIVSQTEIKSDGDVFHELWRSRLHHITNISPDKIQGCELHEGDWGTVGSVIFWKYFHTLLSSLMLSLHSGALDMMAIFILFSCEIIDGKAKVAKDVIDELDEKNKTVILRVIEGDLLELYKSFVITVHVATKDENTLVTWTLEYEKRSDDVENPNTSMDFVVKVPNDIETHHLK